MDIYRLKRLRKKTGLTQTEFATIFGFSNQRYNYYETGKREPDNETLLKFANYFNISVDYLLGNTDDPTPPDAKKEASPYSDRETLKLALIKAGIIPEDRDLTNEEYALLFGAAKGLFEGTDK